MKALSGLIICAITASAIALTAPAFANGHGNKLKNQIEINIKNKKHAAVIAERRIAMLALGKDMKLIAGYLRKNKGGPEDVLVAATRMANIAKSTPGLFLEGTSLKTYPGVTGAKPNIFDDRKVGFTKLSTQLASLAINLQKIAATSGASKDEIGAAFSAVGRMGCGGCHKNYRKKLRK